MDNYKTQGCCVYKHISPSNKIYIGMTAVQPEERWNNGWGYKGYTYSFEPIQIKPQPRIGQFKDGLLINTYVTIKEAKYETKCRHISDCLNGRLKTSKGYEWKYV